MINTLFLAMIVVIFFGIPSLWAQGVKDLKAKVFNEWKMQKPPLELLREGFYFEVISPSEGTCKVHMGTDYLHAETKDGVFVYSNKYVFAVKKRANGFSLVQLFSNDYDKGKEAKIDFAKQMIGLQGKFGPILTQIFPIEVPDYFNLLSRSFMTSWTWLEKSPFIEIESVDTDSKGLIQLVYTENSTKQYGEKGSWKKGILKIDSNKDFKVINEIWTSLNPNLVANGSSEFKYSQFDGNSGPWVLNEFQKRQEIQTRPEQFEKISFSNFQKRALDPDKLNTTFYGIPEPSSLPNSNFYIYLLTSLAIILSLCLIFKFFIQKKYNVNKVIKTVGTRKGFSLLELLIAMGICYILLGLGFSAIQKTRTVAAKLECVNNLRQIGLGINAYHSTHNSLPSGHRSFNPKEQMPYSGWTLSILPEIGEDNVYKASRSAFAEMQNPFLAPPHTPLSTPIKQFGCPSDPRTHQKQWCKPEGLEIALTSYLGVSGISGSDNAGVFFPNSSVSFSEITDGLSNTIIIGERPPSQDYRFGWWYAGSGFNFGGLGDLHLGSDLILANLQYTSDCLPVKRHLGSPSFNNPCSVFEFWSLHSKGENFLFGDSSVRFMDTANQALLNNLATKNGGEINNDSQ